MLKRFNEFNRYEFILENKNGVFTIPNWGEY